MEAFFIAISIALILLGAFGLYRAVRGLPATSYTITRALFRVRGREPSRSYFALSSSAIIVFGIYLLLSSALAALPLWPSLILIAAFLVLQVSAHLRQGEV